MAIESTTIKVDGLKDLSRLLKAIDKATTVDGLKQSGRDAAEIVANEARSLVPVRSGLLKSSIKFGANQKSGYVKAGGTKSVPYAGPIHFGWGSRGIHPQPFLYDALDNRRDEVIDKYVSNLSSLIDTITGGIDG